MRLRVGLSRGAGHPSSNVRITADATVTVGALAWGLRAADPAGAAHPLDQPCTLRVRGHGTDRVLQPEISLLDSGVRSGSMIELSYPAAHDRADRTTAVIIRVLVGPDAGKEVALPFGTSDIGRATGCQVQLADPQVSKVHCRIAVSERIEIIDNNSANGVLVGGVRVNRVALGVGETVTIGSSELMVSRVHAAGETLYTSTDIPYVRSPRVLQRPTSRVIELPAAPAPLDPTPFPWLAMAAPLVMGGVMLLLSKNRGLSLVFIALSPILMVANYLAQRRQGKQRQKNALAVFTEGMGQAETDLRTAHEHDRARLRALHPSVAECVAAADRLGDILWSRRPEHPEFLHVRLGDGAIPALTTAEYRPTNALPELAKRARDLSDASVLLHDAPVTADLRSSGGVGLCGSSELVDGVARALAVQVVSLHSPAEVVLACLTSASGKARWSWLEWLPHTDSPHSPLGIHLSADSGSARLLLEQLEHVVEARLAAGNVKSRLRGPMDAPEKHDAPALPSVLVICDEPLADRARLTRLAERGPDAGVHILWVTPNRTDLPAACRAFLDVSDGTGATVGLIREEVVVRPVRCESVDARAAAGFSRMLSPVVDAGAPTEDDSDLPRSVPVVTALGVESVDDPQLVLSHWRENLSLVARTGPPRRLDRAGDLRAIIGHGGTEPFALDLRGQGPHALVGGTTGAGKSEFLQAWVLGLAHAYSPDRVTFLFVDYKGGAAFAKCVELPHCVGLVTDLSPHLVRRALRSLRAELRYREHLLQRKGQKDLIDLEKTGDPDCPPSLIIVVDEFAALVGEVPEFVDGVVDVAQRGRSLGLHLILATQRPAGVIKDNLRANTNLRVALRMADEHDSMDVLGSSMAAHFDPSIPGRGAAKTGPGRIGLFQSAFPGARTPAEPPPPPIDVVELDFGAGTAWKMPAPPRVTDEVAKDIERVVETVKEAALAGGVPDPRKPWLESLAEVYDLLKLPQRRDTELVLGVVDDPDNQAQVVEYFRPDRDGNIVYIGAGGSGKSTALRALAVAAAFTPRSGPVHVYGLDFGGGGLASLAPMPNVASIIDGSDEERLGRMLRHVSAVVEERSQRFSGARASTLTEYRALSGARDEPRILVLLDGFSTFRNDYELTPGRTVLYNQFVALLGDGRGVGVHVAMTVDRPSAMPTAVMSAFQRKVVLRQAGDDAYLQLGVPRDVLASTSVPGRAMQVDNPQELQLAIPGPDVNVAAQAKLIENLGRSLAPRHPHRPEPIRSLPNLVPADEVPNEIDGQPVLGMRDRDLGFAPFPVHGVVLLSGPAESGRTAAVRWLAESVHRKFPETPLVHISARRSSIAGHPIWQRSAVGLEDAGAVLTILKDLAAQPSAEGIPNMAVFVEYLPEFVGTSQESLLTEVVTLCRRNGHLLVADGEGSSWGKFSSLANECKADRVGMLLQPDQGDGDSLLRTPLPRCKRTDFPPGRGFWVAAGKATRIQLPLVG
jgi:S-DNA-T family DNA segregation ATPase FtsK/SpoIIIE